MIYAESLRREKTMEEWSCFTKIMINKIEP